VWANAPLSSDIFTSDLMQILFEGTAINMFQESRVRCWCGEEKAKHSMDVYHRNAYQAIAPLLALCRKTIG
jgi:hypothetical protein